MSASKSFTIGRRAVLKGAAAAGIASLASRSARAQQGDKSPIVMGLNDPLTGTYAELGRNEQIGCELAIEEINQKGGILGRKVQLITEDSTSSNTGTAVQKAHKLIDRDHVTFFLGNVNSAMA